ncbi:MAG: hypothetical protein JSU68_01755 [Phycisphaerales bacterium]|nr:MAG: hypothetical protein JSU68_01755 [Phycisphaerales bacterium]
MRRPAVREEWWSRLIAAAVRWRRVSASQEELRRAAASDWRTDTGRMRVSLTERLRDIYRRRWLRVKK